MWKLCGQKEGTLNLGGWLSNWIPRITGRRLTGRILYLNRSCSKLRLRGYLQGMFAWQPWNKSSMTVRAFTIKQITALVILLPRELSFGSQKNSITASKQEQLTQQPFHHWQGRLLHISTLACINLENKMIVRMKIMMIPRITGRRLTGRILYLNRSCSKLRLRGYLQGMFAWQPWNKSSMTVRAFTIKQITALVILLPRELSFGSQKNSITASKQEQLTQQPFHHWQGRLLHISTLACINLENKMIVRMKFNDEVLKPSLNILTCCE